MGIFLTLLGCVADKVSEDCSVADSALGAQAVASSGAGVPAQVIPAQVTPATEAKSSYTRAKAQDRPWDRHH